MAQLPTFTHTPRELEARGKDLSQLYPEEDGTNHHICLMRFVGREYAQLSIHTWGRQDVRVSVETNLTATQLEALARDFLDMAADLHAQEKTAAAA